MRAEWDSHTHALAFLIGLRPLEEEDQSLGVELRLLDG